ncbi:MAG TPA: hydrogenase [bacterium]|nr:hydrogenase [bacterium]
MIDLAALKKEAKQLLKDEKVTYLLGYRQGSNGHRAVPAFIREPEEVEQLTWDPTCTYNLTRYLIDEVRERNSSEEREDRPVGILVKGCDNRAINVLLQEKYLRKEDVHVIGISCEHAGMVDEKKLARELKNQPVMEIEFGEGDRFVVTTEEGKTTISAEKILADRCLECKASYPAGAEVIFGDKVKREFTRPYKGLQEIETLPAGERWAFWKAQFEKCIRCYACRSVCTMCYCDECVVDSIELAVTADTTAEEKARKVRWAERSPVTSENFTFHLTRAMHMAGRCVDCGECERACPVDIPLRLLYAKLARTADKMFDYEAGSDPDQPPLTSSFTMDDPGDFIR